MSAAGTIVSARPGRNASGAGAAGAGPTAGPRSYYGRPVLKAPVWKDHVPWYLVAGGLAGASMSLAAGARLGGNQVLARRARLAALAALTASPPLLIADLGRPRRFLNMLRVAKPTSPMSVGTWSLTALAGCAGAAAAADLLGIAQRAGRAAELAGGLLGPLVATYPAVLLADTAVPVWYEARGELPFVFAASAAATGGAAAFLVTPPPAGEAARRLCVVGVAAEAAAARAMQRRLGPLGAPLREGRAAPFARAAPFLSGTGGLLLAGPGVRWPRAVGIPAALAVLAGQVCERFAIFRAGLASAAEAAHTVGPQRARLAGG